MKNFSHLKEKGQVLVLFVLALVVLLGFTSLAVDGAMVYSDRRFDQSAADSAAMAGAAAAGQYLTDHPFSCTDANFKSATLTNAQSAAGLNAFPSLPDITTSPTATLGIAFECHSVGSDKYVDVHVKISSETKTSFAHLFYGGRMINNVESTVRVRPTEPYASGNAIVALDPNCTDNGVYWNGNDTTVVVDGSIFSNSCMTKKGNSGNIDVSGTGTGTYGTFYHDTTCTGFCDPPTMEPAAQPTSASIDYTELIASLPKVNCSNLAHYNPNGTHTPTTSLQSNDGPGNYKGGTGSIDLQGPGLYCIYGEIKLSGGADHLKGSHVTLYFVNGGITITGGGGPNSGIDLELTPPTTDSSTWPADPLDNGLPGMVILAGPGNAGDFILLGNNHSNIVGTVMAPYSQVQLGGDASGADYHAQIIGFSVLFNGNGSLHITYEDPKIYHLPAALDQYK